MHDAFIERGNLIPIFGWEQFNWGGDSSCGVASMAALDINYVPTRIAVLQPVLNELETFAFVSLNSMGHATYRCDYPDSSSESVVPRGIVIKLDNLNGGSHQ